MYGSKICKENGYDANSYTYYPVVIIGSGPSGIAMGCRLKEVLGFDQFRIIERQSGIGGTWWSNRYPGVACDVPAVFYSFSFCPNYDWSTWHPPGDEIVKYLQETCEKYEIVDKVQLNTEVSACRWNEKEQVWDVTLKHLIFGAGDLSLSARLAKVEEHGYTSIYVGEEKIRAKVMISAVGGFLEPNPWPKNIPGQDKFRGEIFHSARWRYDIDLKGKDVIVVGTGCSAAQFVPQLTKNYGAKSVTQLMRSPPWVVPRPEPPGGKEWWAKWASFLNNNIPGYNRTIRTLVAAGGEYDWRLFGSTEYSEKERKKVEEWLREHIKTSTPERYHEILTPNYSVCCKRRIFDATWYPGLKDGAFELTTLPLTSVEEKTVTLGPGRTYPDPKDTTSRVPNDQITLPADVIILANGFEISKWLHSVEMIGRHGEDLQDVFEERKGPQMYLGMAMDGFPNFFAIYGPNTTTGHSSVLMASENMINMALKFIKPILDGTVATTELKKEAELEWAEDTQRALKKRVWTTGGCRSWYTTDSWNSTVYPYSQIWFWWLCKFPTWSHWEFKYTAEGLIRKRRNKMIKYLAVLTIFGCLYQARGRGYTMAQGKALLKGSVKATLSKAANLLQILGAQL